MPNVNEDSIRTFAETKTNFGFEIECFREFYDRAKTLGNNDTDPSFVNKHSQHNGTYIDPISQKARQFDIQIGFKGLKMNFLLAVECKNISAGPIIVCRTGITNQERTAWFLEYRPTSGIMPTTGVDNRLDVHNPLGVIGGQLEAQPS